jgi:hypothetical protein
MYSFLTEEIISNNKIIGKNVKLNLMEKKIVNNLNKKHNYLNTDINIINNVKQENLEEFDLKFNIFNPAKNSPPNDWENRLISRLIICGK